MIPHDHIKIEQYPPRGIGGQHFGSGPSGIRITHIPSGIIATVDYERSQIQNKQIAMDMIEAAVTCKYYRGEI